MTVSRLVLLCLIVFTSFLSGCATIQVQRVAHGYETCHDICGKTPNAYGGTVQAFRKFLFPWQCDVGGENNLAFLALYPCFAPILLIDVPISAVADTIMLPYTSYRQFTVGNVCPSKSDPF